MSRYLERAEHTARLLDVHLNLTLDGTPESSGRPWHRLFASLQAGEPEAGADRPRLAALLTFDLGRKHSLSACIGAARENARQVREQISSEMWEQLNRLYWQVKHAAGDARWSSQPEEFFRAVIEAIYLFKGVTNSTMSRDEGFHYIQLGRFLERACATSILMDVHVRAFPDLQRPTVDPAHASDWVALLRSCAAFEAYCRRHTATLDPKRIADFLLLDAEFPRSVRFAVEQIESSLRTITSLAGRPNAGRPERLAGRLRAALHYAHVDEIVGDDLPRFLEGIGRQCAQVHTATNQTFISYQVETALA